MRSILARARAALPSALALGAILLATPAAAQCMGVSRTIALDPARGHFYNGLERSLGLRDGEVVLTFDDGPMPGTTSRILDALRAECTRATFFMAGRMADANPNLAGRVRREGHTIANHTYAHGNLARTGSAGVVAAIDRGAASIKKATGLRSLPFFRYPYLAKSPRTDAIVRSKGLIAFGTNIDSKDYFKVSPAAVRAKVMGQLRRQRKGIVLMHDIQGRTAAMLPALLDQMKAEGFRVVHIVPGRGAPMADTVMASASLPPSPSIASRTPRAAERPVMTSVIPAGRPEAERRGDAAAVLAAFVRPKAMRRAPPRIDMLGGGSTSRTMTAADKRRAARALRREFRVATDWDGAAVMRLEAR